MSDPAGFTPIEKLSLKLNATIVVVSIVLALVSAWRLAPDAKHWGILLALSAGTLGGMVHEFAQSRGTVMLMMRNEDGLYFGSLAGSILGMVAGLLVVRGPLTAGGPLDGVALFYEAFVAGLALKGVIEATGGQMVESPTEQTQQRQTQLQQQQQTQRPQQQQTRQQTQQPTQG